MSVRLIYGGAGSGKSHFCIENINGKLKSGDKNPLILIVPEQFSFQAEKKLIEKIGGTGITNVHVTSFKRMAYTVFNEIGGITHNHIEAYGKSMIIYKIMRELKDEFKVFSIAAKQQGFVENIAHILTEFKRYKITPDMLNQWKEISSDNKLLVDKLSDISSIYNEFERLISKNYVDPEDDLTTLFNKLDKCTIFNGAEIWIDEFSGFNPQQYSIIEKLFKKAKRINITIPYEYNYKKDKLNSTDAFYSIQVTENKIMKIVEENNVAIEKPKIIGGFVSDINKVVNRPQESDEIKINYRFKDSKELAYLEQNYYAYPFKPYKSETENIKIFKALNTYSEIENIARDILKICREKNIRFNKFAVVTRELSVYEKIIKSVFSEYEIPCFIDKKKDITSNPVIVLITSAIEIFTKSWSYESMFRYIKTGILDITMDETDVLENYILAAGIKGKKKWVNDDEWNLKLKYVYGEENLIKLEELVNCPQNGIEDVNSNFKNDVDGNEEFVNRPQDSQDILEEAVILKIQTINKCRNKIIRPLINFYEKIKMKNTTKKICTALFEFLEEIKVAEKIEELIESFSKNKEIEMVNEYSKIWNLVMELLDQMVEVLGEEILSLDDFVKIISMGFAQNQMGLIPPALDQVLISSVERIKSHDISHLYIIGVNDGVFPKATKEEGIFTDSDRMLLKSNGVELADDSREQVFKEQFLIYSTLSLPSKYLCFSYPIADYEGKSMRPSIIISRIKTIFPKITEESNIIEKYNEDDQLQLVTSPIPTFNELITVIRKEIDDIEITPLWKDVYKWYLNNEDFKKASKPIFSGFEYNNQVTAIKEDKIKKLYGDKNYFSVSRLEKYVECPFCYFVQYGLKAKERKSYTFSSPDLGTFMHSVLDNFSRTVDKTGLKWGQLDKKWCEDNISSIVNEMTSENSGYILNSSPRYKYFTERIKRVLTRTVCIIVEQMRRSDFEPFGYEISFGFNEGDYPPIEIELPSGEIVKLIGRIDRVDKLINDNEIYYRIIDYKSGNKDFKLSDVYYGLQVQLLTYLDAMLINENKAKTDPVLPAGVLYFKIDDPLIKQAKGLNDDEIEKAILKALRMKGLLIADTKIIREMDNAIEDEGASGSPIIPASIKKDGSLGSRSSVATKEQFDALRSHVKNNLVKSCEQMLQGDITIKPYKKKDATPCGYCLYASICQFDPAMKDNNYKIINDKNDKEIWEMLEREGCFNEIEEGDEN